jgi:hypothetical protein
MVTNKNYSAILTNRFFLGALEAAVTPGLRFVVTPTRE